MAAVVVMTVASGAAQALRRWVVSERLQAVLRLFKLSDENTLPAFFSAVLLLACAGALGLIATATRRAGQPFVRHWTALALIFVYLGIDEAVEIHELLNAPLRQTLHADGFLHYPWVLAGAVAVLALTMAYWRFVMHLRPNVRRQVILAAVFYVGGAIGAEMVSAKIASDIGTGTAAYGMASLIEEAMEMTGTVVFLRAMLIHLSEHAGEIRLSLRSAAPDTDSVSD